MADNKTTAKLKKRSKLELIFFFAMISLLLVGALIIFGAVINKALCGFDEIPEERARLEVECKNKSFLDFVVKEVKTFPILVQDIVFNQ